MRALLSAVLVAVALCACDSLLGIDNREPAAIGLADERVVVRGMEDLRGILVREYVLDRVRYVETGNPRSVNRVIRAQATLPWSKLDSLAITVGDTLIVTTRYRDINRVYSAPAPIPNWRSDSKSYLIGQHELLEVEESPRGTP